MLTPVPNQRPEAPSSSASSSCPHHWWSKRLDLLTAGAPIADSREGWCPPHILSKYSRFDPTFSHIYAEFIANCKYPAPLISGFMVTSTNDNNHWIMFADFLDRISKAVIIKIYLRQLSKVWTWTGWQNIFPVPEKVTSADAQCCGGMGMRQTGKVSSRAQRERGLTPEQ